MRMRRLVAIEFITLDGVMQSLGSPEEDTEGGFEYGGWSAPYFDEAQGKAAGAGLTTTDAYLFGRKTFEKMAAFWPQQPDSNPMAAHLNSTEKYVASRTLEDPEWQPTTVLAGDISAEVKNLKQQSGGNIAVLGSGVLLESLIEEDLVDEYRLFVHPLVLGKGKRLFREYSAPKRLQLVDSTPTATGVLMLSYRLE
jgi:dihydrofolate reductase